MSFSSAVKKVAESERNMMMMQRIIVGGVISERDRLLCYTTGEFYQEMSLFIQETEMRNNALSSHKD